MLKDALMKLPDLTKLKPAKTDTVYNIGLNVSDDLGDKFASFIREKFKLK